MESFTQPRFSFIVTVFNGAAFLEETLLSFLHQTESDWEAVIINDGSTDGTAACLDRYHSMDGRFRVYHRVRQGRISALNDAISLARGVYIAINDADDVSEPNRLEVQRNFLEQHPEVGMVGSFAEIMKEDGTKTGELISAPLAHEDIHRVLIRFNPFVHSTVMYRREILEAAGPYQDTFLPGFEWEMYVRVMKISHVANMPDVLVWYRIHANSLTRTRSAWKRVWNVTRARWFVFRELSYPFKDFPAVFFGILDVLPKSVTQWLRTHV